MDDRYLWDQSGVPDPFAARLEAALAAKRKKVKAAGVRRKPRALRLLGLAVATVAAAGVILWFGLGATPGPVMPPVGGVDGPPVAVETHDPAGRDRAGRDRAGRDPAGGDPGAGVRPAVAGPSEKEAVDENAKPDADSVTELGVSVGTRTATPATAR